MLIDFALNICIGYELLLPVHHEDDSEQIL